MHPIHALLSHPRSLSTAMERVMRERGDLECAPAPFMYDYHVHRRIREMAHFEVQDRHSTAHEDIRDMLLARAAARAHEAVLFAADLWLGSGPQPRDVGTVPPEHDHRQDHRQGRDRAMTQQ